MTTQKQRTAARRNIQKAQLVWKSMSSRQHSRSQPEGRSRRKPGTKGTGKYYHVAVRSKEDFVTFRTQDVGQRGHVQRVAGKRSSGTWDTIKWLISKSDAHVENGKLVADTAGARKVLSQLGSTAKHVRGDMFQAAPRRDVPEHEKPTPAQKRARRTNIKKAQAARHSAA
ncbi:MAG: hypothetical protein HYS13_00890 [Planctomycetia bacterium]|nr:hypothetical protein [Planctomycetia bacterium]